MPSFYPADEAALETRLYECATNIQQRMFQTSFIIKQALNLLKRLIIVSFGLSG